MTKCIRLGIVGGGQLASMLLDVTANYDVEVTVLDLPDAPAHVKASHSIFASVQDAAAVRRLAENVDLLTIEIENCAVDALRAVADEGICQVLPAPSLLAMIRDKGLQKSFLHKNSLPTSEFELVRDGEWPKKMKLPFVQKVRIGGYDGFGVKVFSAAGDSVAQLAGDSLYETKVDIAKELACIVGRSANGSVTTMPVVEMVFDQASNQLAYLLAPAMIDTVIESRVRDLSVKVAEAAGLTGLLAVEYFLTRDGDLLINEMAPRLHNSGHHSIEACTVSQFDLFVMTLLDRKLPEVSLKSPAIMANIVGAADTVNGAPDFAQITKLCDTKGWHLHTYGKKEVRPSRKMGHLTIVGQSADALEESYKEAKSCLRIYAKK